MKEQHRSYNKISGILWRFVVFPILCVYIECMYHIAVYGETGDNIVYPVLFGIGMGCIIALLTALFNKTVNMIIGLICIIAGSVYSIVQLVYYKIFETFFSLVSIKGAEDAMNFKAVMYQKIGENIGSILALVLPIAILVLLDIWVLDYTGPGLKKSVLGLCITVLSWVTAIITLNLGGNAAYAPKKLFYKKYIMELSMDKLGLAVTTARDALAMLGIDGGSSNFSEGKYELATAGDAYTVMAASETDALTDVETATAQDAEEIVRNVPQIDESIDFEALYESTEDETLKNLTAYFSGKEPTYKNEYTGMYEGYNVVFITAESLSKYGISDTCTPTLYKLMNEGFVFENFYNPRWYHSTIDGEYVNCLSQYPSSSDWSFYKSSNTYQPYALGNALNELGYTSLAYHDFNFHYYDRSKTHANMGYDFKAVDYGLEIPYNTTYSDYDTIAAVYKEFVHKDKFNMYFMTFSGHLPYDFSMQAMALKNREEAERLTAGMDLPEEAVAYIAAQMELDKALELLIKKLDNANTLDKTLFIITPDHYPYALADGTYNILAGKDVENDKFELHSSCLGIWNSTMEEPIYIDKLCASVDILPTVLNLLGVDYDSRLLAGHDILAESDELVIFADHSFITDKVRYDAAKAKTEYLVEEYRVPSDYVENKIKQVEDILQVSDTMIDADYFSFVYGR